MKITMALTATIAIALTVIGVTIHTSGKGNAKRPPDMTKLDREHDTSRAPSTDTRAAFMSAGTRATPAALSPSMPAEPTQEEQDRSRAAQMNALDQKLRADPFNPVWARQQEEIISQAVAGTKGDGLQVPLPESMDATCQSTLCRIQMTYTDEEDAMQMHTKLTLGLQGAIATARTFYRPNRNGGMDLIVYAGAVD